MKRRYEIGVGCLLVVAMLATGFMALQVGAIGALGRRQVLVTVPMADAQGINTGALVAVAGVEVGSVAKLEVAHDRALVHLALDESAELRTDARVQIRSRSVLGEKYVEIRPRSLDAPVLRNGDRLAPALPRVEIDELVNAMGPLVAAIDPELVNETLENARRTLADDPERLSRMLENADLALVRLADALDEAPLLVTEGRQTLAQARGTLAKIDRRVAEAKTVIESSEALLADLGQAAEPAPELMEEIRLSVGEARGLLQALAGSTDEVETILSNLSEIDRWELRRLLREEGIVVRLRPARVETGDDDAGQRPRLKGKK